MRMVLSRDDLAEVASARLPGIERLRVRTPSAAWGDFVGGDSIDLCEIAVITLLEAIAYGRPVLFLPLATFGRLLPEALLTSGNRTVDDLAGKTVGVQSWSQTTGVWVRGFLAEQYSLNLREVDWLAYKGSNVKDSQDPHWVRRAPQGARMEDDLASGAIDFAIAGSALEPGGQIQPAIQDARAAADEWVARHGFRPVNHVVGLTLSCARAHPEEICAMYDGMRAVLQVDGGTAPVGFAALRGPLETAAGYAVAQGILPRQLDYDEMVAATCDALGVTRARLGG